MAGLLIVTAGCGYPASHITIGLRDAAAHEAIPVAAEGNGGSLLTSSPMRASSPRRTPSKNPGGPIIFGTALFGGSGGLVQDQRALGRRLAIVRVYHHIGDTFPSITDRENMAAGSTLLVSLDSNGATYASIAAGNKDSTIMSFLRAVNRAAFRYHLRAIYISFQHEPDSPQATRLGSGAAFVRAWDHVHRLAASAHLDWTNGGRLHWVLILIHGIYARTGSIPFWPGAAEVDVVAVDGYNSYPCRTSSQRRPVTPAHLFNPVLSFASSHGGRPVFISEWGSDNRLPGAQVRFIQQMHGYVASHRQIAAALYWDQGGPHCSYAVDGRAGALSALAAMGRSAAMQGRA
jgi:hypothetical protein